MVIERFIYNLSHIIVFTANINVTMMKNLLKMNLVSGMSIFYLKKRRSYLVLKTRSAGISLNHSVENRLFGKNLRILEKYN